MSNFNSFREGVRVSFKLDANCPPHISQGKNFSPLMGIKGANASGKTHLLKGLAFLSTFCSRSFATDPGAKMPMEAFCETTDKPTEFFVEFMVGDITYVYELVLTDVEVLRETIYRTKSKKLKMFERDRNEITFAINELKSLRSAILRSNVSIVSLANQYQMHGLEDLFHFFSGIASNVSYGGLRPLSQNISAICEVFHHDKALLKLVEKFIIECDTGISRIVILEDSTSLPEKKKTTYFPGFFHKIKGKEHYVSEYGESSGTKMLFQTLGLYYQVLSTGGILILDEFDINLHPLILPKLLNLFLDPKLNKNNAQLIFTSHTTGILDFLGRYRTYLVTKRDNESFAYRLDEIPGDVVRNDRSMHPAYLEGKIGGVPVL